MLPGSPCIFVDLPGAKGYLCNSSCYKTYIMDQITYERLRRYTFRAGGKESLQCKQSRFVRMVALLIIEADRLGFELSFDDAFAVQGHMKNSLHYRRLAIDLNLFRNGKYLEKTSSHLQLGQYWESIGGSWGGRFADGNHYSLEHKGIR